MPGMAGFAGKSVVFYPAAWAEETREERCVEGTPARAPTLSRFRPLAPGTVARPVAQSLSREFRPMRAGSHDSSAIVVPQAQEGFLATSQTTCGFAAPIDKLSRPPARSTALDLWIFRPNASGIHSIDRLPVNSRPASHRRAPRNAAWSVVRTRNNEKVGGLVGHMVAFTRLLHTEPFERFA